MLEETRGNRVKTKQPLQKRHIMKFIVITALVLALVAVEAVIGTAIYRRAKDVAYNGQINDYIRLATRLANSIDMAFEEGKTQTPDLKATLSGTKITFDGVGREYSAEASIANNMRVHDVNVYRLTEICNNPSADEFIKSDDTVYVVYSEAQEDGTVRLAFRSFTELTADVSFEGFGGIAVFSGSGRSEYVGYASGGETLSGEGDPIAKLSEYRLSIENVDKASAITVDAGSTVYALSVAPLRVASVYTVGGYADYSAGQKDLAGLLLLISLATIIIATLTTVFVYLGAYVFGSKEDKKAYFFTVDPEGLIISRNERFAKDFPEVRDIRERLNRFDENNVYTLKLGDGEENLISCFVKKRFDGTVDVFGRPLVVPRGDEIEMERRDNMSAVFRGLSADRKKVLVGMIYFNNLLEIKDAFGRNFAESVRNILLDRIRKQFEEVFIFDYYTIGVLQSDGTRLNIIMQDMSEVVSTLNRVVKNGENNVLVNVKCGFALSDPAVKEVSYDDVTEAANAALKRACEPQQDILTRVDYYIFLESQRKLYARYLFKIDIPQMLKNGDFYLEYQPQYSLSRDRIVGFEALFRVNRKVQINVSTIDIINYAEQSGNMVLLGNFILKTGMEFAKSIEGMGVCVSLNVSPVQLMQSGFVDSFLKLYRSFDLKPGSISVEITESYVVSDIAETLQKLNILKSNGIDIHLDDFGTGYSSFSYLSVLPIAAIKIDQSFVRNIFENRVNHLIIKMIADICSHLNLESICEGVENPQQLEQVRALGCDVIQGYVISRSVNAEKARDMIVNYHYQAPVQEAPIENVPKSGKQGGSK